jgi:hypothetical protein
MRPKKEARRTERVNQRRSGLHYSLAIVIFRFEDRELSATTNCHCHNLPHPASLQRSFPTPSSSAPNWI